MSDKQAPLNTLVEKFGAEVGEFAGEEQVTLSTENIVAAAEALRDTFGFDLLSCITAVDYWPEENPRFHVIYRFTATQRGMTLNLRVPVPGVNPTAPTLAKVYHSANWHEREVYDMFGIKFEGHPDLRRILMPFDWQGHPLRKDYPLGYEEPQYTFNFDEIAARKPRGRE
jgi:NADH-quinone oxidoreductase subunit C